MKDTDFEKFDIAFIKFLDRNMIHFVYLTIIAILISILA